MLDNCTTDEEGTLSNRELRLQKDADNYVDGTPEQEEVINGMGIKRTIVSRSRK